MVRAGRRLGHVLAVVGVVTVSATLAGGEEKPEGALHLACMADAEVDRARLAEICADFLDVAKSQPGLQVLDFQDKELSAGPGLELSVDRATDTQLELTPTWIDESGRRTTLPSSGFVIVDTAMTPAMRRDLILQVLANPPK